MVAANIFFWCRLMICLETNLDLFVLFYLVFLVPVTLRFILFCFVCNLFFSLSHCSLASNAWSPLTFKRISNQSSKGCSAQGIVHVHVPCCEHLAKHLAKKRQGSSKCYRPHSFAVCHKINITSTTTVSVCDSKVLIHTPYFKMLESNCVVAYGNYEQRVTAVGMFSGHRCHGRTTLWHRGSSKLSYYL